VPLQDALLIIAVAAFVGVVAIAFILLRREREATQEDTSSPFAASTEGMTVCRQCGRGNLVTDSECLYCGAPLPGQEPPS
jgi:hypothetical protein